MNTALASSPYILAFLAALEVLNQAGIIDTPSITSLITGKTHKQIRDEPGIESIDIESRFPNGATRKITNTFNIEKIELSNEADIYKWAQKIKELQDQEDSRKGIR